MNLSSLTRLMRKIENEHVSSGFGLPNTIRIDYFDKPMLFTAFFTTISSSKSYIKRDPGVLEKTTAQQYLDNNVS